LSKSTICVDEIFPLLGFYAVEIGS